MTAIGGPSAGSPGAVREMSNTIKRDARNWVDSLIDGLAIVAGAMMCGLTVLICADVAARYLRLFAMPWSLDIAEYLLFAITFLGAPWVLVKGGHISIDIAVAGLSPPARRRASLLSHAIGALVCAVLLVFSVRAWWSSFSQGTLVHETFVYSEWLIFILPPPIFLIMLYIFLRWLWRPPHLLATTASPAGF